MGQLVARLAQKSDAEGQHREARERVTTSSHATSGQQSVSVPPLLWRAVRSCPAPHLPECSCLMLMRARGLEAANRLTRCLTPHRAAAGTSQPCKLP